MDTNVFLSHPEFILQPNIHIYITYKVICELDGKKYEPGTLGLASRTVSRWIDDAMQLGDITSGVETLNGNVLEVIDDSVLDLKTDDALVEVGTQLLNEGLDIVLLSNDLNVRIKAAIAGVSSSGWGAKKSEAKQDRCLTEIIVSDEIVNSVYAKEEVLVDSSWEFPLNSYMMLRSDTRPNNAAVCKNEGGKLRVTSGKKKLFGLSNKNVDQLCAIDALSGDLPLVTLVGKAGSGKTLLALAAALEALLEKRTVEKILIIRPTIAVGKDIGYLPGAMDEKMQAWGGPIYDNLEVLMNGKGKNLDMYIANGAIEIQPTTFIRGRSLNKTFVLLDEAQSLTRHEIKTIATRIGEGGKLVVTGDLEQIDNPRVSSSDNGLAILIDAFNGTEYASCINLIKGERSGFSSAAADLL